MVASFESFARGNVEIIFSNRHGGCSAAPYNSLNLGTHVGDNIADVIRNKELLHRQISAFKTISPPNKWVFLEQTHKNKILNVGENFQIDNDIYPEADASVTMVKNLPLVCMTADCGPLVLYTQNVVSVVHASWRTVVDEILESAVEEVKYMDPNETINAVLGSCIHPQNYEFDEALIDELEARLGNSIRAITSEGKPAFNLVGAIEHKLEVLGIKLENVGRDTYASEDHFSYRRDGVTGRQAVIAWLK